MGQWLGLGFRVNGVGFRVWCLGFRVRVRVEADDDVTQTYDASK